MIFLTPIYCEITKRKQKETSFYKTGNSEYSSMICQEIERISVSQSSEEAYSQEKGKG